MEKTVDARGLSCPAPVLLVKDVLESEAPDSVKVIVDNPASNENVARFLQSRGYTVNSQQVGSDYELSATVDPEKQSTIPAQDTLNEDDEVKKICILVTSDCLGSGDDVLGSKLMVAYLKTLKEMGPELWHLIFVNGGVKLTIESSPVLEELQQYEKDGVIVLACGTCLEHFKLTDQKQVGATTNMLDIITATQLADKVITIS